MLFFTVLIALAVVSFIWYKNDEYNGFAFGASLITGLALAISLVALPVSHSSGKAEVQRYYALKETYENSRSQDVSEYERATIAQKIAEYNADIASTRYWNNTIFDVFIPDELAELEYLK